MINLNKIIKNKVTNLIETKGFEEMEVAFGLKHKNDNLSDEEKNQFGEIKPLKDGEMKSNFNQEQPKAKSGLDSVKKDSGKDSNDYYKEVLEKMKKFQKADSEKMEPSEIGESVKPKKRNAEEDEKEMGLEGPTGTGMEGLRYDDEGNPNHKQFEERIDDLNQEDSTYTKMKKAGDKYKGYKYGDKYKKSEDEYQETPRVRTTVKEFWTHRTENDGRPTPPKKNERVIEVEGSLFKAFKNDDGFGVTTNHHSNDAPRMVYSYYISTTKSGDLILKSLTKNSLIGDKRIKVPSVERALTYLTELEKAILDDEDRKTGEYDEVIETKVKETLKYSDVKTENIFKTKNKIISEQQVLNSVEKLPNRVKVEETVFAITDGDNFYRLIWESGEPIITHSKNSSVVNENIDKIKHLTTYTPTETKNKINETELFHKLFKTVKNK
jgi:hypothetical protein